MHREGGKKRKKGGGRGEGGELRGRKNTEEYKTMRKLFI